MAVQPHVVRVSGNVIGFYNTHIVRLNIACQTVKLSILQTRFVWPLLGFDWTSPWHYILHHAWHLQGHFTIGRKLLVARTCDTILEVFIVYCKVAREGWVQRALLGENHIGVSYAWTPTALLGDDFEHVFPVERGEQVGPGCKTCHMGWEPLLPCFLDLCSTWTSSWKKQFPYPFRATALSTTAIDWAAFTQHTDALDM